MNETEIARRMDRLERRSSQLTLLVLGLVAALVGLVIYGRPTASAAPALPDKNITARAFRVVDEKDKTRAELSVVDGVSQLVLLDNDGKVQIKIAHNLGLVGSFAKDKIPPPKPLEK